MADTHPRVLFDGVLIEFERLSFITEDGRRLA
jgi:hypothetical protein